MNCEQCNKLRSGCKGRSNPLGVCTAVGNDFLDVRDWLADIKLPPSQQPFDCVEIRFKNGRKVFYKNASFLELRAGDVVAVESSPGHDIGVVSIVGELARIQMRKKNEDPQSPELKKIYRLANQRDIDLWQNAISREKTTLVRTREICQKLNLSMKLCDVEYQGDNLKATFFYTAEGRIDFRQLIKELAASFGVRIEMRQIGLRQEAARVGSIGSCGRELCCATWLTDFRSVNTSAARYQRLSLNPQKLAGQCGKLKCCLNYELDVYIDALKDFPSTDIALHTEKGTAHFQKMDVFKGIFWYSYDFEFMNWIGIDVQSVIKIQQANRRSQKPESLEFFVVEISKLAAKAQDTQMQAVEEGSLTRFDSKSSKRPVSRDRRGRNNRSQEQGDQRQQNEAHQSEEQNISRNENQQREQTSQQRDQRPHNQARPQRDQRQPRPENGQNLQRDQRQPRPNNTQNTQQDHNQNRARGEGRQDEQGQQSSERHQRGNNRRRQNNRPNEPRSQDNE